MGHVQWYLSIVDATGPKECVLIREVSFKRGSTVHAHYMYSPCMHAYMHGADDNSMQDKTRSKLTHIRPKLPISGQMLNVRTLFQWLS